MKQFVLLTVMAATASLGTAWAGANVWTSLGPDRGVAWSLVIDPLNPNTVYALTNAGLFKSTDAGANRGLTPPLPPNSPNYGVVLALVIDPQNPTTLYAETTEEFSDASVYVVLQSTDGGGSWRELKSGLFHISHSLAMGLPYDLVKALVIDPRNTSTLYAGTTANGVYQTTDGGANWSAVHSSGLTTLNVYTLVIDPQTSTVYAGTAGGVFAITSAAQ